MKKILLILFLCIVLGATFYLTGGLNKNTSLTSMEEVKQEKSDSKDIPVTAEVSFTPTPTNVLLPGTYTDYSMAQLTDNTNIIFFAAAWCPSCQTLDKDITNNLENIPTNLTILKANYDSEQDLRIKYGVTIQHTLVQVDKDGNELNKWNGLYNLSTLKDVLNLI